jgi:polyphenol oxidase
MFTATSPSALRVPLLETVPGLTHGFGRRAAVIGRETGEESRARWTAELRPLGRLHLMRQVHGVTVHRAPWEGRPEGDAALGSASGVLVGVETADCLPILVVDPIRRVAAAVHAGWRGTAAGVLRSAIAALEAAGCRPGDLLAALGPAIGACCYEVGEDVEERFGSEASGCFRPGPRGRPHLDLRAANERQLLAMGLDAARIAQLPACTFCGGAEYHSYRREGKGAGRMLSFVGFVEQAVPA